jgi:hypothetical protein
VRKPAKTDLKFFNSGIASENAKEFTRWIKAQEGIKLGIINIEEEQEAVRQSPL